MININNAKMISDFVLLGSPLQGSQRGKRIKSEIKVNFTFQNLLKYEAFYSYNLHSWE
jgi:hypothetical protein